ncbi:hypothetical protein GGF44_002195 [Coemansia sp. RSA 1694]|nr:hypothetical protein GGF44_002195 [Coemansia sp. RSA 1694]
MLKDNDNMLKGLLVGQFEVPLAEMGCSSDSIQTIRTIPAEESDIQHSTFTMAHPHSGRGMDALTDSFFINAQEVEQMLDYNPWSINSFIMSLCSFPGLRFWDEDVDVIRITNEAAKVYWMTEGITRLIGAHITRHRKHIAHLAKRLLYDYEVAQRKTDDDSLCMNIALATLPPVALTASWLDLLDFDSGAYYEPTFLSLCLYGGYLTRRLPALVRIPNLEIYTVWRDLLKLLSS